ncbi:MAG: hypothetical protein ACUVXI_01000 [bacterium]
MTQQNQFLRLGILSKREVLAPFDASRILPEVTSNELAALAFEFRQNKIKLTNLVVNLTESETIGHLWYDVSAGKLFKYWLAAEEVVGGGRNYYFRYWYRFIANNMKNVNIDCDDKEWVIFTYPVTVKNSLGGNPISYGFNKWKSDFDLSAKVYVGYDTNNLYFYVTVYDDTFNTGLFSIVISDSDSADKQEKILTSSSLTWGESYSLGEIAFVK